MIVGACDTAIGSRKSNSAHLRQRVELAPFPQLRRGTRVLQVRPISSREFSGRPDWESNTAHDGMIVVPRKELARTCGPGTIGVQGDWGAGKPRVLKMLESAFTGPVIDKKLE